MAETFDLVVVGSGSGGSTAARKCRRAGWTVAVVDSLPFGGTCALRGCDPKKVLVGAAERLEHAGRMQGRGVRGALSLDWAELIAFERQFIDPVPAAREAAMREIGIVPLRGRAHFVDEGTLAVGDRRIEAARVLVATGARPAPLTFPGADLLVDSTAFLRRERLPDRLVFVGGGYISFEFAHIAARAGAEVTIVHRGTQALAGFDADLAELLVGASLELGIAVELGAEVAAVKRRGQRLRIEVEGEAGRRTIETDLAVHGAGRVPATAELGPEQAGIEVDDRGGIVVNEYLQSVSNERIYAAGDVAATEGAPLTPVASHDSHVVAANLLHGNHLRPDYSAVPSVVFTLPPLARVGLDEGQAASAGYRVTVRCERTTDWYSTRRLNGRISAFKTLVDADSDRIVGAHLLGHGSEETINLFAMAMRQKLTASELKQSTYAYPTHASDIPYML